MQLLDPSCFDDISAFIGDTPFSVTPTFFLQRRACDVHADSNGQPRWVVIVPHTPFPDAYVFGREPAQPAEAEQLAEFLAKLNAVRGCLVPVELVQAIRARCTVEIEVEGLCFTYRQIPEHFHILRPESARRLTATDADLVETLPDEALFLYQNFGTPAALLNEGLAFGVIKGGRVVSMAASLALTPKYCDVGVYTVPRYRNRRYATDGVEALFAHLFVQGRYPLWRIGVRQKVAIYFAEKLEMEEIGINGQEVYLQINPLP